jgi:hypothetical protein
LAFLEWWKQPENSEKRRGTQGDKPWSERCKSEVFASNKEIDTGGIVAKKYNLFRACKNARAGVNTTGAGKDEGDATLDETLKKKCRWYSEVEEVLGDKPNAGLPEEVLDTGVLDPRLLGDTSKGKAKERTAATQDSDEDTLGLYQEDKEEEDENEEEELEEEIRRSRREAQHHTNISAAGETIGESVATGAERLPSHRGSSEEQESRKERQKNLERLAGKRKGKGGKGKGGKDQHPAVNAATDRMKEVAETTERMERKRLELEDKRNRRRDIMENNIAKRRLRMEERAEVRREKVRMAQEQATQKEEHIHKQKMAAMSNKHTEQLAGVVDSVASKFLGMITAAGGNAQRAAASNHTSSRYGRGYGVRGAAWVGVIIGVGVVVAYVKM